MLFFLSGKWTEVSSFVSHAFFPLHSQCPSLSLLSSFPTVVLFLFSFHTNCRYCVQSIFIWIEVFSTHRRGYTKLSQCCKLGTYTVFLSITLFYYYYYWFWQLLVLACASFTFPVSLSCIFVLFLFCVLPKKKKSYSPRVISSFTKAQCFSQSCNHFYRRKKRKKKRRSSERIVFRWAYRCTGLF